MSGFGNSKAAAVSIRPARTDEQKMLESLQRRASLSNPGDRDALLANPDAIAVPLEQLAEGCVFVCAGLASLLACLHGGIAISASTPSVTRWRGPKAAFEIAAEMRRALVSHPKCDLGGANTVAEQQRASGIESHFLDEAHRAHSSDNAKPMREVRWAHRHLPRDCFH